MQKYNLLVGQSGGPTAAINSSLAGVISGALKSGKIDKVLGAKNGIEGVLDNKFIELNNIDLNLLSQTPSAYLGSCRKKLPKACDNEKMYEQIFSFFKENNIKYFLYIGGNDSMDTVYKLSSYAKEKNISVSIIGVPKTIDNDLDKTDHTPGFGSAAKYIATTIKEITKDSQVYFLKSVTIVEIMGRHTGWLTAAAGLARNKYETAPHLIYLPETPFSIDKFILDINMKFESGINNIIVAVSEGIADKNGKFICEDEENCVLDAFGHKSLSGVGKILENAVKNSIGCKVRSIELNVSQRCATHILSKTDIEEAFLIGENGSLLAINGETGKMMIYKRVSNNPYKIEIDSTDISEIANFEKKVNPEFIIDGNDIKDELIEYIRPLILGEVNIKYENGLPVYLYI